MTPSDFPSLLQASPPSRRTAPSIPTAALSTASVVSSRRSSAASCAKRSSRELQGERSWPGKAGAMAQKWKDSP